MTENKRIPLSTDLALERFLDVFTGDVEGIPTSMTCTEVEAMADLLLAHGHARAAEAWIAEHAEEDDCGDWHCKCDDPECIAERDDLTGFPQSPRES